MIMLIIQLCTNATSIRYKSLLLVLSKTDDSLKIIENNECPFFPFSIFNHCFLCCNFRKCQCFQSWPLIWDAQSDRELWRVCPWSQTTKSIVQRRHKRAAECFKSWTQTQEPILCWRHDRKEKLSMSKSQSFSKKMKGKLLCSWYAKGQFRTNHALEPVWHLGGHKDGQYYLIHYGLGTHGVRERNLSSRWRQRRSICNRSFLENGNISSSTYGLLGRRRDEVHVGPEFLTRSTDVASAYSQHSTLSDTSQHKTAIVFWQRSASF